MRLPWFKRQRPDWMPDVLTGMLEGYPLSSYAEAVLDHSPQSRYVVYKLVRAVVEPSDAGVDVQIGYVQQPAPGHQAVDEKAA